MKNPFFVFLVLCSAFFSCAEDQNFNQVNDLNVIPTVATSIFYFESTEDVINATPIGDFFSQTFIFNAFNEDFVSERILDGTIVYQLENTTSKELSLLIEFIDADDVVLDNEAFVIQAQPTALLDREVFYGENGKDLDILRNTARIRVTSENRGDTISESTANDPKIILRSSAIFRVQIQ